MCLNGLYLFIYSVYIRDKGREQSRDLILLELKMLNKLMQAVNNYD